MDAQFKVGNMDPDHWTFWGGFKVVLRKTAVRAGVLWFALTGAIYLAWNDVEAPFVMPVLFAIGSVAGAIVGYVFAKGLVDQSGIEGRKLALPVAGGLLAVEVAACYAAAWLRHGGLVIAIFAALGVLLWSVAVCLFKLLMEK